MFYGHPVSQCTLDVTCSIMNLIQLKIKSSIGERERANLVVRLARFFYIFIEGSDTGGNHVHLHRNQLEIRNQIAPQEIRDLILYDRARRLGISL